MLFSHALIRDYQNGVVPLDEMLLRFKFISLCNRGRRRDIETIFEDTLRVSFFFCVCVLLLFVASS